MSWKNDAREGASFALKIFVPSCPYLCCHFVCFDSSVLLAGQSSFKQAQLQMLGAGNREHTAPTFPYSDLFISDMGCLFLCGVGYGMSHYLCSKLHA